MTLNQRIEAAKKAGLIKFIHDDTKHRVALIYRKLVRNPGDCVGDKALLQGLAIAEELIGQGPGWIPRVQELGCKIADLV